MADGAQIPVQNVVPGETVQSYDPLTGIMVPGTVSSNNAISVSHIVDINNGELFASGLADQPIYVKLISGAQGRDTISSGIAAPVLLGQLRIGMNVYNPVSRTWIPITSIKLVSGSFLVYDLKTTGYGANDYIANNIVVMVKTN